MKLLDEKEYKKTLRELMETPFGGHQQKPTIKQPEPEPKVINEQPVENQNIPVYATPQPQPVIVKEQQSQPSPFLHKTGTAQISLTRLGAVIAVGGAIFGYLYTTNPTVQTAVTTGLAKLSAFMDNPFVVTPIVVGVLLCTLGLIFKR